MKSYDRWAHITRREDGPSPVPRTLKSAHFEGLLKSGPLQSARFRDLVGRAGVELNGSNRTVVLHDAPAGGRRASCRPGTPGFESAEHVFLGDHATLHLGAIDERTSVDSSDFRNIVPRFEPEARKANRAFVDLLAEVTEHRRSRARTHSRRPR